jgi:Spy/CpxP family protein refolding chaperone
MDMWNRKEPDMKTGWKALMVIAAVLALVTGLVMAGPGGGMGWGRGPAHSGGPGMGMGFGIQGGGPMGPPHSNALGAIGARLNLTDEQKAQIRQIQEQGKADAEAAQEAVAKARDALHDAVIGGASEADIRAAATALGEAIGNQAVLHAKTVAAAEAVLTPEQLKKFEELRAKLPGLRQKIRHEPIEPNDPNQAAQASIQALGVGGGRMSLERMFKAADTNKDGSLTLEELRAFRARVREARQKNQ